MSTEHTDNSIPSKDSKPTDTGTDSTPSLPPNDSSKQAKQPSNQPDEKLSGELSDYHKALAEEFELANKELSPNTDSIDLKEYWKRKVPDAAAQIAWLAMNAHSEGVRLNANKYIVSEAYAETGNSELETILRELTGKTN